MRLGELFGPSRLPALSETRSSQTTDFADVEVGGITANWLAVRPGWLFAALVGAAADGREHIDEAIGRGAVAVLAPTGTTLAGHSATVPLIVDDNPRRTLALLAARFYGRQPRTVVAVTGTNGKTSVVDFVAQLWTRLGRQAASLGTLGLRPPGRPVGERLTTPLPTTLHECLARLADTGFDHLAIEASSIGLVEHRLDGVELAAAAFTNLSREHLGYHGSLEAYRVAKHRLFDSVLPPEAPAVLNADSAEFNGLATVCRARGQRLWTYGRRGDQIRLVRIEGTAAGQRLTVDLLGRRSCVNLPLIGGFQIMNALCALGIVLSVGEDPESAFAGLAELRTVPGRLECVARHPSGAPVYVDFAHTPDGLQTVLETVRPLVTRQLVVVFGCGGSSDREKREEMGDIAARLADRVIVTDDNPRDRDPAEIRADIVAVCPAAIEIGDRAQAIDAAIRALRSGDVLVIAGKGHETMQIAAGVARPFNDGDTARAVVGAIGAGTPE